MCGMSFASQIILTNQFTQGIPSLTLDIHALNDELDKTYLSLLKENAAEEFNTLKNKFIRLELVL